MTNETDLHVIFGAGPVGMAVMEELVARGKQVRMINRSGQAAVPEGVKVAGGDATDPASTRSLCEGAAVVYNCTNPPYDKWPELFPALQAGVVEGAAAAGAKLVVMENVYMYGSTGGAPLTEDLPYAATTRKGRVRARMAEDLLAAHRSGKVRVTMGRASDFFGPRALQAAMGERVFYPALEGKPVQLLGDPDLPHTQTYIPDIGKGLVILGEREEALGEAWHLPAPETVTQRRFVEMVFEETGQVARIQAVPNFLVRLLGLFNVQLREVGEMLYEFEEPFIVDHSKFERAFGNHATLLQEAIRATVAWFHNHPR